MPFMRHARHKHGTWNDEEIFDANSPGTTVKLVILNNFYFALQFVRKTKVESSIELKTSPVLTMGVRRAPATMGE